MFYAIKSSEDQTACAARSIMPEDSHVFVLSEPLKTIPRARGVRPARPRDKAL